MVWLGAATKKAFTVLSTGMAWGCNKESTHSTIHWFDLVLQQSTHSIHWYSLELQWTKHSVLTGGATNKPLRYLLVWLCATTKQSSLIQLNAARNKAVKVSTGLVLCCNKQNTHSLRWFGFMLQQTTHLKSSLALVWLCATTNKTLKVSTGLALCYDKALKVSNGLALCYNKQSIQSLQWFGFIL